MNIQPIKDRILVKVDYKDKTASGIILTGGSKPPADRGEVMAIGSKVKDVAVGDMVLFDFRSGLEMDEGHLMLEEMRILAVIE
jgi:chaperonin GroES